MRAFFARYYHPGNASLAIAGDIDAGDGVRPGRASYFGEIPAGPPVVAGRRRRARGRGRERLVLEDRVELPRLYLAWPSPALFAPATRSWISSRDLLANGRTSRLYERLIHERAHRDGAGGRPGVARARQLRSRSSRRRRPATRSTELDAAIVARRSRRLATDGPTADELERGRAQAEAAFVYRLQTLGGFGGKADQLNAYNVYRGKPDSFDDDLRRYLEPAPAALRAAVRTWLDPAKAVALSVVPAGAPDLALPGSTPVHLT